VGIVIDIPKAQRSYETIIVKFPCDEPPEEWLESDFETDRRQEWQKRKRK
jgi:hypothetical protein